MVAVPLGPTGAVAVALVFKVAINPEASLCCRLVTDAHRFIDSAGMVDRRGARRGLVLLRDGGWARKADRS